MEVTYSRPRLTAYQRRIIDSPARFTITEAATKTGKTASHIIWLFEQALQLKSNQSVWWVAPVYGQAEIAFRRMRNQVSVKDFFRVNESKLRLELPMGSIIQFKSAEKPDNLYGDDVYAAVFDEFTRAREDAWFALRSTLTKTEGKCKLIGNVKGKKNWGYRLGQKAKAGEKGYEYHRITAIEAVNAGILTSEEVEQAQRDLPESVFRELYMAEASEDTANPFGLDHIRRCIGTMSVNAPRWIGVDLAKSVDWTVITGLDNDGRVCLSKRFQKDWRGTVEDILALPSCPVDIDSTGVGDPVVEEIQRKREGVRGFKFTATSKQQIMEGLAVAIQQGRVRYPPGVIVDELENFEYEYTRTGVRYTAPAGLHDDCVCSLAMVVNLMNEKKSLGNYTIS